MDRYIIGVDCGGTVIKAAVFDTRGKELAVHAVHTPLSTPKPGYTQRDMETLWEAGCTCICKALEKARADPGRVSALAVGGHGKGLYPWGRDGRPACDGIVSTDNRAWRYPEKWRESGVFDALYPRLCQQLIPGQQAALLAWMKDHERAAYDNIRWVFSVKDYMRFRLTGEAYSELTDLSGSGLMDVRDAKVDRGMLETLGIGEVYDKLPPLRMSSDLCGYVTAEAARATGLLEGTPVAGGMFDIDACAIAMDMIGPESLCTITGTWSINEFIARKPVLGTAIAMNSLYAIPGYYLVEECSPTSAGNLEWALENLLENVALPEGTRLYDFVDEQVAAIPPDKSDVFYLPFLYGSNAHALAKASFVGLTSFHTRNDMLRAVYEGVAYAARTHIDRLLSVRERPGAVRMAGGAANSAVWVQMFADVLGLPVQTVSEVKEIGALGCAMAAAVCSGVYPDYHAAAQAMVRISPPVFPNPDRAVVYQEKYQKYTAVKDALDTVWDRFRV